MTYDPSAELAQLDAIQREVESSNAVLDEVEAAMKGIGPVPTGLVEAQLAQMFDFEAFLPQERPQTHSAMTSGLRC